MIALAAGIFLKIEYRRKKKGGEWSENALFNEYFRTKKSISQADIMY